MTRILMVLADPDEGVRPERLPEWVQCLPEESTAEWPYSVDKVRYSVDPSSVTLPVHGRELLGGDLDGSPRAEMVYTWDILVRLEDPLIVHICRPYTRAGEVALLAAKVLRKSIVLSDFEPRTSAIGESFRMSDLADCLICDSDEAKALPNHRRVEIVDFSFGAPMERLNDIYRDLATRAERPA